MLSYANTETIPALFLWIHGGSEVSLSGSFVEWVLRIPMTPVQDNPTVFQVIYPLVPGYHEYKFCVDGEWRHDERQPFVNGSLGYVNTVNLQKELSIDPAENDHLLPRITMNSEMIPRILETELEMTRRHVLMFLSTHTACEMLPKSGKVIALDVNVPVKQAFHILYEQGIPVAPLWDFQKGLFVRVLTALDFILILMELGCNGSKLTEEELEKHTVSAWKKGKVYPNKQNHGNRRSQPRLLVQAGPYDSLKDVALKILQNNIASLPIIHSTTVDGSYPELLHIASLSDVLKCICRYFRRSCSSLPTLQRPISSISLGTWVPKIKESSTRSFHVLSQNATLSAALSTLVRANISSVPVVDEKDALADVYSRSDITALAKNKAYAQIRLNEISIQQALQLGQGTSSPIGCSNGQRYEMCLHSDPLYKVMERLANPGVRRLVVVEAGSRRVEGIVSLSDVFRLLLG